MMTELGSEPYLSNSKTMSKTMSKPTPKPTLVAFRVWFQHHRHLGTLRNASFQAPPRPPECIALAVPPSLRLEQFLFIHSPSEVTVVSHRHQGTAYNVPTWNLQIWTRLCLISWTTCDFSFSFVLFEREGISYF